MMRITMALAQQQKSIGTSKEAIVVVTAMPVVSSWKHEAMTARKMVHNK